MQSQANTPRYNSFSRDGNKSSTYLVAVTSITYANKGQNLLQGYGYSCDIQRTPKNFSSGCGYCLKVKGDINRITAILNKGGVRVKEAAEILSSSQPQQPEYPSESRPASKAQGDYLDYLSSPYRKDRYLPW